MDRVQALRFFQAHNHERFQRLIELASPHHGVMLQVLPLLFHLNSKVLPGFINDDVPAGLIDYQPDKTTLDKAKELETSFKYRRKALRRYPLRGLYLIHPQGVLNATDNGSLQLWLLHSDNVNDEQRHGLTLKLNAVVDWMQAAGLTVEYKLLAEADIHANSLQGWEIDLFYHSGMVLAGSVPYWWLSTTAEDQDYQHTINELKNQRMLNQVSFVDFGAAAPSHAERIFTLCYQAIKNSLHSGNDWLELEYLHTQLEQGELPCLSHLLKQQVHQQKPSLSNDISHLKLLQIAQHHPASHAREALYLVSRELLSKSVKQARYPWRRAFIQSLVQQWYWSEEKLQQLDQRDYAANKRCFERIGESCHRLLKQMTDFAREHALEVDSQLAELKKCYQLRFKPAADVIDCLPKQMRPASNSDRLFLHRFQNHSDWFISFQLLQKPTEPALFRHESLLHVLAWAVSNQILSRSNWLSVNDQLQKVSTNTVVELSQHVFRRHLADSDLLTHCNTATQPESIQQIMLFSNLERQASDSLSQQGLQLSSKQNDPFNYTSSKQSLVLSVDGLLLSNTGQWHSFALNDDHAPLELLIYLLNWQPSSLTQENISGWCPTPIFGQSITQRLSSLTAQLCRHYQQFPQHGRLLLNYAGRAYSLQWQDNQADYTRRPASQDLWQALAENRHVFTPSALDNYLDSDGLFNYLLQKQASNRISVFIYLEQNTIICYLLDELGNLIRQQFLHLTESTLVAHLHKFLSEIKNTRQIDQLHFYRLRREKQGWQRIALATPAQTRGYLPITVTMTSPALDAECTVLCGQKSFRGRADEPALFSQIHKLVLSLRQQKQHYPIYLNSLIFADGSSQPTAVYMQQKYRLEQLFNPN
ncbi:class I adenylate cyclase [Methylophaga thiooxydans]|uniref:class I adenylate cyclase n=1 Tax=Methylophaga thiooxydans TaxID=392484 RepID=UPI0023540DE1|nr:class I adenylate cyclase [Methylophaga thiooxydans]